MVARRCEAVHRIVTYIRPPTKGGLSRLSSSIHLARALSGTNHHCDTEITAKDATGATNLVVDGDSPRLTCPRRLGHYTHHDLPQLTLSSMNCHWQNASD